jgi:hypothetical protein
MAFHLAQIKLSDSLDNVKENSHNSGAMMVMSVIRSINGGITLPFHTADGNMKSVLTFSSQFTKGLFKNVIAVRSRACVLRTKLIVLLMLLQL